MSGISQSQLSTPSTAPASLYHSDSREEWHDAAEELSTTSSSPTWLDLPMDETAHDVLNEQVEMPSESEEGGLAANSNNLPISADNRSDHEEQSQQTLIGSSAWAQPGPQSGTTQLHTLWFPSDEHLDKSSTPTRPVLRARDYSGLRSNLGHDDLTVGPAKAQEAGGSKWIVDAINSSKLGFRLFGPKDAQRIASSPKMKMAGGVLDQFRAGGRVLPVPHFDRVQARRQTAKKVRFATGNQVLKLEYSKAATGDSEEHSRAEAAGDTPRYDGESAALPEADIWPLYLEHALVQDKEMIKGWNDDLDSILIFAALFSGVLTALIIESYKNLQPDPQVELLRAISMQLQQNTSTSNDSTTIKSPVPPFQLTRSAIRVNIYWFSSLIISLSTAFVTILAKQWVNHLLAGLSPVPSTQGRHRQYRMDGLHKWHLPAILSLLPLLLHVALLLFFAGLVDFVWALNSGVGVVSAILVIVTFGIYATTNLLSYIYPESPFKTSVTVFISLGHELIVFLWVKAALLARLGWATIYAYTRVIIRLVRVPHEWGRGAFQNALSELRRAKTFVDDQRDRLHTTFRMPSHLFHDETFVSKNTSFIDSRVLLWLVHNVDRLARPRAEELGHTLMRFPHLIRHRQLLIQDGVSTFLERLLMSWFRAPWSGLHEDLRPGVSAVIRTLGMLATEAEEDGAEFQTPGASREPNLRRGATYFLSLKPESSQAKLVLSSDSTQLVGHLLADMPQLPLPLAAFTLRLYVAVENRELQKIVLKKGTRGEPSPIDMFVNRITGYGQAGIALRPRSELIPAVNTIIYLALWDISDLGTRRSAPPGLDVLRRAIHKWMAVLLTLVHSLPKDGVLLRQICWAMCILSWAQSPKSVGIGLHPLVPRLKTDHNIPESFASLLSCDQDPQFLKTVIMTAEEILWNVDHKTWNGQKALCGALNSQFEHLLSEACHRLPASQVAQILIPLSRIAAYLSFFDQSNSPDVRTSLVQAVLTLMKKVMSTSATGISSMSGGHPSETVELLHMDHRLWIVRSACRIIQLHGENPRSSAKYHSSWQTELPRPDSTKLAANVDIDIVSIVRALQHSPKDATALTESFRSPLPPDATETFCTIMHDFLTRGFHGAAGVDKGELRSPEFNADIAGLILEALDKEELLETLLHSPHSCVHVNIFTPVVHQIYAALFAVDSSQELVLIRGRQVSARYNRRHPTYQMATALHTMYPRFLSKFTEKLKTGIHLDQHNLLVELTGITGYLAFFTKPDTMPLKNLVICMVQFLTELMKAKVAEEPFKLRRHAWGVLGNLATLYARSSTQMVSDPEPGPYFCAEKATPEEIALGFMRTLSARTRTDVQSMAKAHCLSCVIVASLDEVQQLEAMPDEIVQAALEMLLWIWESADPISGEIRLQLGYQEARLLVSALQATEGAIGQLAKKLVLRMDSLPSDNVRDRRLTV